VPPPPLMKGRQYCLFSWISLRLERSKAGSLTSKYRVTCTLCKWLHTYTYMLYDFFPPSRRGWILDVQRDSQSNGKEGDFHRKKWTTRISSECVQQNCTHLIPILGAVWWHRRRHNHTFTFYGKYFTPKVFIKRINGFRMRFCYQPTENGATRTLVLQRSSLVLKPKAGIIPSQFHPHSIFTTYFPKIRQ
jgi:hypothetical protein